MLKVMLKAMVSVGVFLYRLTGGGIGGRVQSLPVLLLTTIGRKSGQPRTVPLGYLRDGSTYVIIAAYGGLPRHPAWFFNLRSQPHVQVRIQNWQSSAVAEIADPEQRKVLWEHLVRASPMFARYEKLTQREIPMVLLHPQN